MNTKKTTAFIVGAMLIATVLVMAVSAAGMDRSKYADMPRMVYEYDAVTDTGIYINDMGQYGPTLRIYGEEGAIYPTQSYTGADDFIYPDPVDAFDPGVIGKDSVTFNPAYMYNVASIDGDDYLEDDMKVFFRVFYEPMYGHVVDELMDTTDPYDNQVKPVLLQYGALVTETTYMLVEDTDLTGICGTPYKTGHSGDPITGAAGVTRFTLPVRSDAEPADKEPGMDWEEVVDLLVAENGSIVTNGTIEVGIEVCLDEGDSVRFMDHNVTLVEACIAASTAEFDISYIGNRHDREAQEKPVMVSHSGANVYVNRYNDNPLLTTDAEHRWFIKDVGGDCDGRCVIVGRRLVAGETFYVDGVRYDMPAIYVADNDEFKYITLQSPLPKCPSICTEFDDFSHVSCQYLMPLPLNENVWVLPPFDDSHSMIDDIDLDKKYNVAADCWYLDTEAGNIIRYEEGPLQFFYDEEDIEERFNSSLAERHYIRKDGVQIWNWWNIYTKPYNYTELVLPDQETTTDQYKLWNGDDCPPTYYYPNADGNEYLVTTSFIAPNSEAEERDELCKSSDEVHDIIDRAATIAVDGDDRRDAYNGTPRMVFEYNAFDTEDLFVNDDGTGNATVRVYGEAGAIYPTHTLLEAGDCAVDFIYPNPVDPFDPGVIAKDSVTFNPAYIHGLYGDREEPIKIDGSDADEKIFLRVFYEPGYAHSEDCLMLEEYPNSGDLRELAMPQGALVTETTYMLVDYADAGGVGGHSGLPKAGPAGAPGNSPTRFMLPINSLDATVPGMDNARVVELTDAVCGGSLTSGEIEVSMTWDNLAIHQSRTFMDHRIKYEGIDTNGNPLVDLWYVGNMDDEHADFKNQVELVEGTKTYVDRPNLLASATSPRYRWFVTVQNTWNDGDNCKMTLGRRLVAGETFYVDGVRYDMPAVYVTDDDGVAKFKYITFQSPLPKCDGPMWEDVLDDNQWDWSHVPSQWLANIVSEPLGSGDDVTDIWVLPPFNENHTMIDDIDLDKSWNCGGTWENISVEAAGNILGDVGSLKFYYIAEEAELRFDSSLAERHAYDGSDEIWNWWSIFTKPYQYTELVLPDQENTTAFPTADGNEYLITTSFIAPNCEGAVRDMDNEPFCKPYDTHDIIDRASTLREGPDLPTRFEGDVNDDTIYPAASPTVTGADAQLVAQHIVGTTELTGEDAQAADVNDDDPADPGVTPKITGADLQLIKQYIVGTITEFPAGVNGQCIP